MVPEGWNEDTLSTLLDKIIDYRGQSVPKAATGVPLITARNVRLGYLDFTAQEYVDEASYESWMKRGTPRAGDILFTTEAPLGMVCRYPASGKYAVGQRTVTLRTSDKMDSEFLLYTLLSERGQRLIDIKSSGSTAKGIKSSELKKIRVPYPPSLPEQQKIARILSTWDKAITNTEKRIDNSKQQKKALMQQLLTGKKRFPGFEGEWEEVKLSTLAQPGKGNFTDGDWIESPYICDDGCRLIQTGNIGVGFFKNKNKKYISESSFEELKCTEVQEGDLLICRLAEPAGRACVVPKLNEKKMLTSVDVTIFKVDLTKSSATYLSLFFSLDHTLYTVSSLCGGSTRSRVSRTNLGQMKIRLPKPDEQQKIATVLTNADKEIKLLEQQLADLKQEKKALMQQLLTGKRRVKVDEAEVA